MFGRKKRTVGVTGDPPSEHLRHATKDFLCGIENVFEKYSEEHRFFRKAGAWAIKAKRESRVEHEDVWRHMEVTFEDKPVALLEFRILDTNLVGTIAIFDWNGMSTDDCDWLLFGMATMLTKPGLRDYPSARRVLRSTMNETIWNKVSGVTSFVCPRASISVPMSGIVPLTTADWYHLHELGRFSEAAHASDS